MVFSLSPVKCWSSSLSRQHRWHYKSLLELSNLNLVARLLLINRKGGSVCVCVCVCVGGGGGGEWANSEVVYFVLSKLVYKCIKHAKSYLKSNAKMQTFRRVAVGARVAGQLGPWVKWAWVNLAWFNSAWCIFRAFSYIYDIWFVLHNLLD